MTRRRDLLPLCILMAGLLSGVARVAEAQERRAAILDLHGAWVGFADDGIVSEAAFGAALRWYPASRLAVGPEALYFRGDNHRHLALTANLTWDVLRNGRREATTPFLVVGAGIFQTRETFFGDSFTSTEGAFTAGGGVRARITDRVSAGVDARVGWETHIRIGAFVGINLAG